MVKLDVEYKTLIDPKEAEIDLTREQYEAIRGYAQSIGYEDLRGFHWALKRGDMEIWSYYEALRAFYQ